MDGLGPAQVRRRPPQGQPRGWAREVHPALQRVYAARGVLSPDEAEYRLARLLAPAQLGGLEAASALLAEIIDAGGDILVAGDYDCDGATGTAVAVRGLQLLGARHVSYVIPNRATHGYGLSPALIESLPRMPALILTVDNGVASVDGVALAKARGSRVIVTDHHLPGEALPAADAMVNPNLQGEAFPSKALAGVGVMFYLMLALRAWLRQRGDYAHRAEPDLGALLDLVALGTVADLVPLDFNNRILVDAGLRRIRSGRACPGILSLLEVGKRDPAQIGASDLGFAVGPRLNAAGRLEDMSLGVECLLTDDVGQARDYAVQLDRINRERRALQSDMVEEAQCLAEDVLADTRMVGICLFDEHWHPGVIGLVASRVKDQRHRPVVTFAPASADQPESLRGSARSISGFHIRDALALIDAREPGLIERFGGHAMAAGLSLPRAHYPRFAELFNQLASEMLDADQLSAVLLTDGELQPGEAGLDLAQQLRRAGPWGQAFPEPLFDNVFDCVQWRIMGEKHWRLRLRDPRDGHELDAVMFNVDISVPPPTRLHAVYELGINDWQGRMDVRLILRQAGPA
ncbi:single-stranded-DNA-specific exonuclease RecJ [Frateuria aurantia]